MIMSDRLPERVNPYRLADQGRVLEGSYPLNLMPRLAEAIYEAAGEARVRMAFSRSPSGLALIEGQIEAMLALTCQRCLGRLDYPVDTTFLVALLPDEATASSLLEEYDAMVVPEELFIRDFIEDELMLSVPQIPRHEHLEDCDEKMQAYLHKEFENEAALGGKPKNPFEALSSLKSKH
jgi:uncharacterized protein